MSELTIYADSKPSEAIFSSPDFQQICHHLNDIGVHFERWHTDKKLEQSASNEEIIAAYQNEIDKLVSKGGYQSYDVVSLNPDNPNKLQFRQKFLSEHIHTEDEVRFFVRGKGLFVMHVEDKIYAMLCEKDDLISVPANTKHWFDMGSEPEFTAIRIFDNEEGWVAQFTGDDIADKVPKLP
ncbi:1,2-dihydroxy-3-keto-5-methylthiopentene dioxygenase [Catenovulum sediminis]|uniref:1,2-dihydroxy-3-keto-5-methylthiopentene dioxygenase n=1 Tax=Catenovulum sediminis TaxID=1740262 RepID=UPI001180A3DA|nr:acireductone dioxygenase [Catenovulum sediminis]